MMDHPMYVTVKLDRLSASSSADVTPERPRPGAAPGSGAPASTRIRSASSVLSSAGRAISPVLEESGGAPVHNPRSAPAVTCTAFHRRRGRSSGPMLLQASFGDSEDGYSGSEYESDHTPISAAAKESSLLLRRRQSSPAKRGSISPPNLRVSSPASRPQSRSPPKSVHLARAGARNMPRARATATNTMGGVAAVSLANQAWRDPAPPPVPGPNTTTTFPAKTNRQTKAKAQQASNRANPAPIKSRRPSAPTRRGDEPTRSGEGGAQQSSFRGSNTAAAAAAVGALPSSHPTAAATEPLTPTSRRGPRAPRRRETSDDNISSSNSSEAQSARLPHGSRPRVATPLRGETASPRGPPSPA